MVRIELDGNQIGHDVVLNFAGKTREYVGIAARARKTGERLSKKERTEELA